MSVPQCVFMSIDKQDEMCFILEEDINVAVEKLTIMKEVLLATESCKPKLDRSLKVSVSHPLRKNPIGNPIRIPIGIPIRFWPNFL